MNLLVPLCLALCLALPVLHAQPSPSDFCRPLQSTATYHDDVGPIHIWRAWKDFSAKMTGEVHNNSLFGYVKVMWDNNGILLMSYSNGTCTRREIPQGRGASSRCVPDQSRYVGPNTVNGVAGHKFVYPDNTAVTWGTIAGEKYPLQIVYVVNGTITTRTLSNQVPRVDSADRIEIDPSTCRVGQPSPSEFCWPIQSTATYTGTIDNEPRGTWREWKDFSTNSFGIVHINQKQVWVNGMYLTSYSNGTCTRREIQQGGFEHRCVPDHSRYVGQTTVNGVAGHKFVYPNNVTATWGTIAGESYPLQFVFVDQNGNSNSRTLSNQVATVDSADRIDPSTCP